MSIDFHRLMEPIDINRLIFIDYIDYIDCFPMIDFHRLDPSGCFISGRIMTLACHYGYFASEKVTHSFYS